MKPLIGALVFGLAGLLMLWGAWHSYKNTRHFLRNAVAATGRVVELKKVENHKKDADSSKYSVAFYPVIQFTTKDGRDIRLTADSAVNPDKFAPGAKINIYYDPANPQKTQINDSNSLWATSIILAIMGGLFLGAALLTYFLICRNVKVDSAVFIMIGLGCATALMVWGAVGFGKPTWDLWRGGVRTTGVVVAVNGGPVIEYPGPDGKKYRFQSHIASYPPKYYEGDKVTMIYDRSKPDKARILEFIDLWLVPGIFVGFGMVFLGALVWLIVFKLRS